MEEGEDMADIEEFDASDFDVDDTLDNTFLGIPGLKRSQSPQSNEDENDDTFSFLRGEPSANSPSAQPESIPEEKEEAVEPQKEPTPVTIEPQQITTEKSPSRVETTPAASVPPESMASFTYENTPEVEFPVKRKRGRPAKHARPPINFTEPNTPRSVTAEPPPPQPPIVVTPVSIPQLAPEGDEGGPVELDSAGEAKVTRSGYLAGGREYAIKTFTITGHGDKLFMLATEVARLTGYRDSYLFFLRNRNLRKVVTTQTEKEDLISQEVIPFSYRSRQISVVAARSVFMQFGHRVIANGQRVRDDYYEERARRDHHAETHMNETRELRHQAAVAAATAAAINSANAHAHLPPPAPVAIASSLAHSDTPRPREWHPLPKAKPPIYGAPWHENYQPLTASLMLEKAQAASRYNSLIAEERKTRANMWKDWWTPASARVKAEAPPTEAQPQPSWVGGAVYQG